MNARYRETVLACCFLTVTLPLNGMEFHVTATGASQGTGSAEPAPVGMSDFEFPVTEPQFAAFVVLPE